MDYILKILPYIAEGSIVTLELFVLTLIISLPLGLLLALGNLSRFSLLRFIIQFYILIIRGTPLMLQVLFVYFGLPVLGIRFDNFTSALIAFSLNYGAYFAEIFRGGIEVIDKGQYEASFALGLSRMRAMRLVILPQAFSCVLPSMSNETITLVKDTALVQIIALEELLRAATLAVQRDLNVVPFFVAAIFYLAMTILLTWAFKKLETKYSFST